jgi:2-keto-4-pentenoate hydratase/2-oxohepta-3-ene-1,7-dioic acid hydratase in catechol pathway
MNPVTLNGKNIYPSKVVCIGRNYVDHIKELNNDVPAKPVIFIKPNSAISSDIYFNKTDIIHFEAEISFIVRSKKLIAAGFGLDLTKRDIQSGLKAKGLPWERAKAFDKSAVFSDFVSFNGNADELGLELYINDVLVQKADCSLMLNKPQDILTEVNSFLTLADDDLLMTGTPKGVGAIQQGDRFHGKILQQEHLLTEASWVVK